MFKKDVFKDWKYNGINSLISWGASVVIIGLMFKILHFPFGDYMIALGLITEAILFFILGFQQDDDTEESPQKTTSFAIPEIQLANDTSAKIETGLKNFADKVSIISNAADAALATTEFVEKLKAASANYDKMSETFQKSSNDLAQAAGNVEHFSVSAADSERFKTELLELTKNMAALNAVYTNMLSAMNQSRS